MQSKSGKQECDSGRDHALRNRCSKTHPDRNGKGVQKQEGGGRAKENRPATVTTGQDHAHDLAFVAELGDGNKAQGREDC
ncbi:MAG: hypothetical protein Cons2KO_04800 [Congregibacter sp.]